MTDNRRINTARHLAGGGRRLSRPSGPFGLLTALALGCALAASGCETPALPARAPGGAPTPTYAGPAYLRGTVGSLARLRPGTERPILVSGYGIVVNLNGTGSTSAPPALRLALLNQMRKYGLGSAAMNTLEMTPERVLADPNTAVVRIDGFIPPGSTPGLRFDVLVTSVDSQTTSLSGGTLWTATLGINGANQAFKYLREQAAAHGPIYDNPYHDQPDSGEPREFGRQQALVVAGGKVTASRELELVLNQASYTRSRAIADRINERFGKTTDRNPMAHPLSDQLIRINIPPRFQHDPGGLVDLIMHLYLQTGPGYEPQQARRLAQVLQDDPENERSVKLAWQALGRPVVEVLRGYYPHPQMRMRISSLEAGAWLGDERASQFLSDLATDHDPYIRERVARALVRLPRSLTGAATLKDLLDDEDTAVRIAAYESLASINDRLITHSRVVVADAQGTGVLYVIDAVPAKRPLVYITQIGVPRIVVFSPDLGFKTPLLARLWSNRLMLAMQPDQGYLDIFYQPPARFGSDSRPSIKLKASPDLKTLIYLLGHTPTVDRPNEGLGMSYSQVVDVIYQLCRQGHVQAPIEVVVSPLARQIADRENAQTPGARPETRQTPPAEESLGQTAPVPAGAPTLTARPDTARPVDDPSRTSSR